MIPYAIFGIGAILFLLRRTQLAQVGPSSTWLGGVLSRVSRHVRSAIFTEAALGSGALLGIAFVATAWVAPERIPVWGSFLANPLGWVFRDFDLLLAALGVNWVVKVAWSLLPAFGTFRRDWLRTMRMVDRVHTQQFDPCELWVHDALAYCTSLDVIAALEPTARLGPASSSGTNLARLWGERLLIAVSRGQARLLHQAKLTDYLRSEVARLRDYCLEKKTPLLEPALVRRVFGVSWPGQIIALLVEVASVVLIAVTLAQWSDRGPIG